MRVSDRTSIGSQVSPWGENRAGWGSRSHLSLAGLRLVISHILILVVHSRGWSTWLVESGVICGVSGCSLRLVVSVGALLDWLSHSGSLVVEVQSTCLTWSVLNLLSVARTYKFIRLHYYNQILQLKSQMDAFSYI